MLKKSRKPNIHPLHLSERGSMRDKGNARHPTVPLGQRRAFELVEHPAVVRGTADEDMPCCRYVLRPGFEQFLDFLELCLVL